MDWRTQVDPDKVPFDCGEMHACFFQPSCDQDGTRPCVTILIPETPSDQMMRKMKRAMATKVRVMFLCDTRDQADEIATRAGAMLREHRRVAYERAEAGQWQSI